MAGKDHLTVYYSDPVKKIPIETREAFSKMINEGVKPSKALVTIIKKFKLGSLDISNTLALIEHAYPGIYLMGEGLQSRIVDSNYPNNTEGLTHEEFDEAIDRLKDVYDGW
ncbi:hypothetical protein [Teredinibacter sp. KSP-S5-2]|uniref:hypothetical protein n=1 Tax=Teredinibacter sp. KSP-S5-2 TaxID=3034506 RepID=UPI002934C613|nr:hypothetical protein [Teredinibacter sp. KSP-S5-2]WNO08324.1 hypothetical protein P5V12_15240 [Teredinibacter sp. KSP-S5-2]